MEFGSDFHKIEYPIGNGLPYRVFNHYVSGRQPLFDIVRSKPYSRVWIPSYYCGESLKILDRTDVEIKRYHCLPTDNPEIIDCLNLKADDLLLRVNYFGIHGFHDSSIYPCDVAEDHTHDLLGEWASNSNARWCFASIRKTLPTADGGVLWSPHGDMTLKQPESECDVEAVIKRRYNAMEAKAKYLHGCQISKDAFLREFRDTEECFSSFSLADWSSVTNQILESFDVRTWYNLKRANYIELLGLLNFSCSKPVSCNLANSTPFSLIVIFNNNNQREVARHCLIQNNIYPAILWSDVYGKDPEAVDFSKRILSVHCDGRYSKNDMQLLAQILNKVI